MKRYLSVAVIAAFVVPVAAYAQFSDSYNFLKAVRDADGDKATEIITKPGSVIIDTRDTSTGECALHIVVKRRDTQWIRFLLSRGAKPDIRDKNGDTPLMAAAAINFVEGAEALVKGKANVDLANNGGETPLIRAVHLRNLPMVRLLLSSGANPDKRDRMTGKSARDYAKGDPRAAAILRAIETPAGPAKPIAGPTL